MNGMKMRDEHPVRHKSVTILLFGIIVAAVIVLGIMGWQSYTIWRKISTPPERKTPYSAQYQAKKYDGLKFANGLLTEAPDGVNHDNWNVDAPGKGDVSSKVLASKCSQIAPSTAQIARKTADGDGVKTIVLIYGAGQAKMQFDKYATQVRTCQPDADVKDTTATYNGGFLTTRGDSIVSVLSDDKGKLDKAAGWYLHKIDEGLATTSCAAMDEKSSDANRSFYYDPNGYVGTIKQETVSVSDPILATSAPQELVDVGMDVSKAFPDPKTQDIQQPDDPLPANVQTSLPQAPNLPSMASRPTVPAVSKTVSYQVVDEVGPGCGWSWSGQKVPKFNEKALKENRTTVVKNARTELKNTISDYNRQAIDWSAQSAMEMSFQSGWDDYVNNTNAIYASWKTVNDARAAVRPAWMRYVDQMNAWSTWDQTKSDAQRNWDDSVKKCVADETSKNNQASPTSPSNPNGLLTPDDVTNMSKKTAEQIQSQCESSTPKPDILSQQKPAKPTPPSLPNGISIPNSWTKPRGA